MKLDTQANRAKAFDYLFDAVVVTDMNGIITDWNKGSEVLYGYTREEAIGQLVSILHVPEDSGSVIAEVMSAVQNVGKWSGEIRMLHKSGSIGWIESICVPMHTENGEMEGALGINRDITQRKKETERLQHRAHYDYLTDIPNRYLLLDRLKHLIAQSKRNNRTFALFFIDLNKFKLINDTKGHAFGDQVLVEVAKILKSNIRNSDTVARFGGDEFILLIEDIHNAEDALFTMKKLSAALNTEFIIYGEKFSLSSSIGVALYPDDGASIEQLISVADKAMYTVKLISNNKA